MAHKKVLWRLYKRKELRNPKFVMLPGRLHSSIFSSCLRQRLWFCFMQVDGLWCSYRYQKLENFSILLGLMLVFGFRHTSWVLLHFVYFTCDQIKSSFCPDQLGSLNFLRHSFYMYEAILCTFFYWFLIYDLFGEMAK